jgi:hypothetical protein
MASSTAVGGESVLRGDCRVSDGAEIGEQMHLSRGLQRMFSTCTTQHAVHGISCAAKKFATFRGAT